MKEVINEIIFYKGSLDKCETYVNTLKLKMRRI